MQAMKNHLFAFTWPPCSGKSTTISELKNSWFQVISEAQMEYIGEKKQELWWEEEWKSWIRNPDGTINKSHFSEFIHACLDRQIQQEAQYSNSNTPILLDRSVIDCLTFAELREIPNAEVIRQRVHTHIEKIGWYNRAFHFSLYFAEFEKRAQEWRVITLEEARRFDILNRNNYEQEHGHIIVQESIDSQAQQITAIIQSIYWVSFVTQ